MTCLVQKVQRVGRGDGDKPSALARLVPRLESHCVGERFANHLLPYCIHRILRGGIRGIAKIVILCENKAVYGSVVG